MLRVYEVAHGETFASCAIRWHYLATAVWRPTERSGHVVARNLAACIVALEVPTARDQDACPKLLHVVTLGTLHVVASHYM